MKKKIILVLIAIIVVIQFFRPDFNTNSADDNLDFLNITQPSEEVASIIKSSCYDCHSNFTESMWYMNIAPISWWIKDHIDEGKEELNFSDWGNYNIKRKNHKLEECIELIEENEMPLESYTIMHKEAKLSDEQKTILTAWFKEKMLDEKE